MDAKKTVVRSEKGFTLIELLVVVLIIGILASIAIPQYFKVVERARVSESQSFVSQIKQAQERYLARNGDYAKNNTDIANLDITFPGSSPFFGMKFFSVQMGSGSGCPSGEPGYNVQLTRVSANAGIAPRYTANYTLVYERCSGQMTYPSCPNCATDFAQ